MSLYWVEFASPVILAVVLLLSGFMERGTAKLAIGAVVLAHIALLSFRPGDYNSDTQNYLNYVSVVEGVPLVEAVLLTKLEPFHFAGAYWATDLRLWLLIEGVACALLSIGCIRRYQRLETIAVILGCALPLFSSSIRFCTGILAVAYLCALLQHVRFAPWLLSIGAAAMHVSLAVAGVLLRRRFWIVLVLLVAFLYVAGVSEDVLERSGASDDNPAQAAGLRAFMTVVLFLLYVVARDRQYRWPAFLNDAASVLLIFGTTLLWFPLLNRWLILLLVLFAAERDASLASRPGARVQEGLSAAFFYFVLVAPFLISLSGALASEEW